MTKLEILKLLQEILEGTNFSVWDGSDEAKQAVDYRAIRAAISDAIKDSVEE
jgi:hypothetical protein